jgi:hypothetical protein
MNELAKHIASLLLENDCVIIPDFGGFIAHYTPAQQVNEENIFLPPMREIGFNPQLRINDGLLAQSYMSVYGSSFPDAVKTIQKQSEELISAIHETGYMELDNVGELRYNIQGKYEFTPFDHRIATPGFYGLDSFKMQELKDIPSQQVAEYVHIGAPRKQVDIEQSSEPTTIQVAIAQEKGEKNVQQRDNVVDLSKYLRNIAAVAAVIILILGSYFISTSVEKIDIYNEEAGVLPKEILKESLAISSIVTHQPTNETTSNKENKTVYNPSSTSTTNAIKMYNVIVASVGNADIAQREAINLVQKGYPHAKAIIGDGKARVCVESFENEADAYRAIQDFKAKGEFEAAWVLKK